MALTKVKETESGQLQITPLPYTILKFYQKKRENTMPSELIFDTMSPIQMDNNTGKIAMTIGGFHEEGDMLTIGLVREKALAKARSMQGTQMFPQFRGGYFVEWAGLSESQRLIILICRPNRGLGPVPEETLCWCDENSILTDRIPELG